LTPSATVTSGFVAGAKMTTFFAPPGEMLGGAVVVGEEAGRPDHDIDAELAPRQRTRVALGEHLELLAVESSTVPGSGPRIESYLSGCASVLASVRSLTATHSTFAPCLAARKTFRPIEVGCGTFRKRRSRLPCALSMSTLMQEAAGPA
jgi:hypothetical protein